MELTVTPDAVSQIKHHIAETMKEQPCEYGYGLRLAVKGGGCGGFQYETYMEELRDEEEESYDHVIEVDGITVLVDMVSANYLDGSKLDYESSFLSSGFNITNPHAVSTCGCGNSFSI